MAKNSLYEKLVGVCQSRMSSADRYTITQQDKRVTFENISTQETKWNIFYILQKMEGE